MYRRHRLGDGPQLHRLRAAGQRRDLRDVRGRPGLPGQGPLLGDHREVRGDDPLHRADGDPDASCAGAPNTREARLSSLRLLGTVGEPINPEAWVWYREHIGGERCPVVDTWWQTETGA